MASREELWTEKRNAVTRMREIFDRAAAENRAMTPEESTRYDEAADRVQAIETQMAQEDRHAGLVRSFDELGRSRSIADPEVGDDVSGIASPEYNRSWTRWLRRGERGLRSDDHDVLQRGLDHSARENRALSEYIGSAGGYLVTPTFLNKIYEVQKWFGGAFQVGATLLITSGGEDVLWPTNDDTGNTGEMLNEGGTVSNQDVTFGQMKLSAYIFSSKAVYVPIMLLADENFGLEGFLGGKLGTRLARIHNTKLTTGSGANEPQGMATGAATGVTTAAPTAIVWNEMIDLEHSVDPAYRRYERSKYMFHDTTLKVVRKLQDADGRSLWQPALQSGVQSTINNYQYVINNDMPLPTATLKSMLFGDFESYYVIRQVSGVMLFRLQELKALQLQQVFFAVDRLDGGVQDATAVKAMVMHA